MIIGQYVLSNCKYRIHNYSSLPDRAFFVQLQYVSTIYLMITSLLNIEIVVKSQPHHVYEQYTIYNIYAIYIIIILNILGELLH